VRLDNETRGTRLKGDACGLVPLSRCGGVPEGVLAVFAEFRNTIRPLGGDLLFDFFGFSVVLGRLFDLVLGEEYTAALAGDDFVLGPVFASPQTLTDQKAGAVSVHGQRVVGVARVFAGHGEPNAADVEFLADVGVKREICGIEFFHESGSAS
jgi:hypothetical protein